MNYLAIMLRNWRSDGYMSDISSGIAGHGHGSQVACNRHGTCGKMEVAQAKEPCVSMSVNVEYWKKMIAH